MLHSCKAATHSNPLARPPTSENTISASCGQPLHASSLPWSSSASAGRLPAQVAGKDREEDDSEEDRRAQGTEVASSTRRLQSMGPMMTRTGHHSSAAHRWKRGAACRGPKKLSSFATKISILSVFSCLHDASKKCFMALRARKAKIALAVVM